MKLYRCALLCAAISTAWVATNAMAASASAPIVSTQKLSWRLADRLAAEAVNVCESRGLSVTATVVDSSGQRQAVVKGDTVGPHSLSVSFRKAFTAYAFGDTLGKASTGEIVRSGVMSAGAAALDTEPDVLFMPGGVTIRAHGKTLLGGLGVSGAPSGDKDEACAAEALARHQSEIDK